jgi:hypothetical protein
MNDLNKWLGIVVVALLLLTAILVLMVQEDGTVLISNDSDTLPIVAVMIVAVGYFVSDTLKSRDFTSGYGKLIDKLTENVTLADTLESNYLAMPEGLPKNAVDLLADIAKHLVKMTPTDADDKLAGFIDDIRDGVQTE